MNFKDMVIKNRSYRKFDESRVITADELRDLVDTARFTPSSVNIQPFKYYISCDSETNAKLRPLTYWARLLKGYDGPAAGENPTGYVVVCYDKKVAPNTERFAVDLGIISQTIMLAAVEKGLGGCMIKNMETEKIAEVLGLPENILPAIVLALGAPDEEIILEELAEGQKTSYYRDENNKHHVPKRKLDDVIIGK